MAAPGAAGEEYSYRQRKGAQESTNTWTRRMIKPGRIELTATKKATGEFDRMICDSSYGTLEWFYTNKINHTSLHAMRETDSIRITGQVKGKPVNKTIKIETVAWHQFSEFAFSRILADRQDNVIYSTFWPEKMSFYKMKAARIGEEKIRINGKVFDTIKVKVTLDGFKSIFWSSKYWFRKSDYLFLKYEGVNGLAGTDTTVVELISR